MRRKVIYLIIGLLVALIILVESFSNVFSRASLNVDGLNLSQKLELFMH